MKITEITWLAIFALLAGTILITNHCNKPVNQPILDTNALTFSRDSAISSNKAIVMEYEAFKKVSTSEHDSLVRTIQKQASSHTISIAAISTKTSVKDSGTTIITHDTVRVKGDSVAFNPIYTYDKVDSTQDLHVVAGHDSTHVEVTLFNLMTVESKFQSSGFLNLGSKSIVLEVTNSNPHIRTTNQMSFVKPLPKPNRLLWLASGIVAGSLTVLYLTK